MCFTSLENNPCLAFDLSNMLVASNIVKVQRKVLARHIFTSYNPIMDNQSSNLLPMYWYEKVSSTMDKVCTFNIVYLRVFDKVQAKDIAKSTKDQQNSVFGVVAEYQYKGRGTRGRVWTSGLNNLFLTVAIKQSLLPIPLNYIPLR